MNKFNELHKSILNEAFTHKSHMITRKSIVGKLKAMVEVIGDIEIDPKGYDSKSSSFNKDEIKGFDEFLKKASKLVDSLEKEAKNYYDEYIDF